MPEAAVHEHRPTAAPVGDVWAAGEIAVGDAVLDAETTQDASDDELGLRVLLTDARHALGGLGVNLEGEAVADGDR
jgi:hypothetical protein